jgi:hypothetical protein
MIALDIACAISALVEIVAIAFGFVCWFGLLYVWFIAVAMCLEKMK